jgi:hypothetical protein
MEYTSFKSASDLPYANTTMRQKDFSYVYTSYVLNKVKSLWDYCDTVSK